MNKQVLPALVTLSNDADMGVRELSIDALAEVFKLYGSSRAVMEKLTTHLDALMTSNVHEVRPTCSPGVSFTRSEQFHRPFTAGDVAMLTLWMKAHKASKICTSSSEPGSNCWKQFGMPGPPSHELHASCGAPIQPAHTRQYVFRRSCLPVIHKDVDVNCQCLRSTVTANAGSAGCSHHSYNRKATRSQADELMCMLQSRSQP